jgi:hypothetical protein
MAGVTFDVRGFANAIERAGEAVLAEVVQAAVEESRAAQSELRSRYPQGKTGRLRSEIATGRVTRANGIGQWVRANAPHAAVYEKGSPPRFTERGWHRGRMSKHRAFIPVLMAARDQFYRRVQSILDRPKEIR